MSNSVKNILKIFILLIYLIILLFILENHYVAIGECATRIYYYPLGSWDYFLIPLVGVIMLSLSLYYIHTSLKIRVIEAFIYVSIITFSLICGNNILASRTIDWPERYSVTTIEKSVAKLMKGHIEHKDFVFDQIEKVVLNNLPQDTYSYSNWVSKTHELIGVDMFDHSSDYEYLNHKCNILDYLNWHLIKMISLFGNEEVINGINSSLLMTDSLLLVQYDLMKKLFESEDLRYDFYGLALEIKSIINDDLITLYSVLSNGTFRLKRITQIDEFPYQCPYVGDDLITKEYQRFITEYIPKLDEEKRTETQMSCLITLLTREQTIWKNFIQNRNLTEQVLSGKIKDAWRYNTKVWKLNKIRQLKNEFECYGTMSELDNSLSLQDCNYTELMNYHSFSKAWEDYDKFSNAVPKNNHKTLESIK